MADLYRDMAALAARLDDEATRLSQTVYRDSATVQGSYFVGRVVQKLEDAEQALFEAANCADSYLDVAGSDVSDRWHEAKDEARKAAA